MAEVPIDCGYARNPVRVETGMSLASDPSMARAPVALFGLALLAVWETAQPFLPLFAGSAAWRDRLWHGARNLGLGVVNALVVRFGFLALWVATMEWSARHAFGLLHWMDVTGWPRWILAVLLLDLWTYTWHRLSHAVPLLWYFHRLHHSDEQMDVTTASRFHLGEIVGSSVARIAVLALIGCTVAELAVYETLLFAGVQFHHANVTLPNALDRVVRVVLVTPHLHKVHHSVELAEQNANFSSLFTWWDRLARTFRLSAAPEMIAFGVREPPPRV